MKPNQAVAPAEDGAAASATEDGAAASTTEDGAAASTKPGDAARAAGKTDVVLVHGVTEDGKGLQVIRHRDNRFEAGAVRPLVEGKPIHGELVRLRPRKSCPLVCDVDVELPQRASIEAATDTHPQGEKKGPAQVASDRYRSNWDAIWKRARKNELAS